VLVAGCVRSTAPAPTEADVTRARAQWPAITIDELNRGHAIYVGHCGTCHLVPKPRDHRPEDWPAIVDSMSARAELTDDEEDLVVRYVVTMASSTGF
jgi:hypothetical protein